MNTKKRCSWCNLNNPLYVEYHDHEWCVLNCDDKYLYEMLILESFQAGLSWECVLNKREAFHAAFDGFDIDRVCLYDEEKIAELLNNKDIIRNRLKIRAAIDNSRIFMDVVKESLSNHEHVYLRGFGSFIIKKRAKKTARNIRQDETIIIPEHDIPAFKPAKTFVNDVKK